MACEHIECPVELLGRFRARRRVAQPAFKIAAHGLDGKILLKKFGHRTFRTGFLGDDVRKPHVLDAVYRSSQNRREKRAYLVDENCRTTGKRGLKRRRSARDCGDIGAAKKLACAARLDS